MITRIVYITIGLAIFAASAIQLGNLAGQLHILSTAAAQNSSATSPVPTVSKETVTQASSSAQPQASASAHPDIYTFVPKRITIDTIQMDLAVVSVPLLNGTWAVNDGVANFAEGTSLVNGMSGNVGIYGHDRSNAFTTIKKLMIGDTITIWGDSGQAVYKVSESNIIEPNNVGVFYTTTDPELTLITCNGLFSDKRYMVKAKLISIK
jgi:LPXTG-site transpeptidase (sortase) family protein